jgi:hypothetical protein
VLKDRVITSRDGVNYRNFNGQPSEGSQWGVHLVNLGEIISLPQPHQTDLDRHLTAIIGSVINLDINDDGTFAVLKLKDHNGSIVNVLVEGSVGESLSAVSMNSIEYKKGSTDHCDGQSLGQSHDQNSSIHNMKSTIHIQSLHLVAIIRNPRLLIECNPLSSNKGDASKVFVITSALDLQIIQPLPSSLPTLNLGSNQGVPLGSNPTPSSSLLPRSLPLSALVSSPTEMALLLEEGIGPDPDPLSGMYICIYVYTYEHQYIHVYIKKCVCAYASKYIFIYIHIYID